jgi:hypothetical protein
VHDAAQAQIIWVDDVADRGGGIGKKIGGRETTADGTGGVLGEPWEDAG